MFRVPASAKTPTFDDTFTVSFWRWLTSRKVQRGEWVRRRRAAAQLAAHNQRQRLRDYAQGDHGNDGDHTTWRETPTRRPVEDDGEGVATKFPW